MIENKNNDNSANNNNNNYNDNYNYDNNDNINKNGNDIDNGDGNENSDNISNIGNEDKNVNKGEVIEVIEEFPQSKINYFKIYKKNAGAEPKDRIEIGNRFEGGRLNEDNLKKIIRKLKIKLDEAIEMIKKIKSSENTLIKILSTISERSNKYLMKKNPKAKKDTDLCFWLQTNGLGRFYEKLVEFEIRFEDLKLLNERKLLEMNLPPSTILPLTTNLDYTRWNSVIIRNLFKVTRFLILGFFSLKQKTFRKDTKEGIGKKGFLSF